MAALAAQPDDDERRLYREVWRRWLVIGDSRSPVGPGLSVVYQVVEEAARRADPGLFGWDEDDGVEVLTDPTWQQASHAALAAALAVGVPQVLGNQDSERLGRRWRSVLGPAGGRR